MSVLIALGSDGPLDHALPPDLEGVRIPLWSRGGSAWPSWTSHCCYTCRMARVASRELRNQTRALLERVEAGEEITITVVHEIAHHFGIEDDRLHELGWG